MNLTEAPAGRRHGRLQVSAADGGSRIDQFLARQTGYSRSWLRRLIDLGGVHCQGRRLRQCGYVLQPLDQVEWYYDGLAMEPFRLCQELVLLQDGLVLAVNKPAGIDMQPTPARFKGTLYEALCHWLQNPDRPRQAPTLAMVQRLDRETSGLVLFSIHPRAHKALTRQFVERQVDKRYLALLCGELPQPSGEFRSLLARQRSGNRMKSVVRGGREAITAFRLLHRAGGYSLVEARPLTGRTHQIRVHFAEAGYPLAGDALYGGTAAPCARTMLHAWRLSLQHPVTAAPLQLQAPLPQDFYDLFAQLEWSHVELPRD
ncbi:RluA family pseudouridine synthase [Desulfuromonas thiophila]|uniref:Pseudouridine synthase n=1 Tax=Desulfuromonas thiophila TaxID=57664 RepID=A0A1G7CZB4_9BACT|nr:RluA family pseudouridine synthase [Desulfuromonas thiophila]SDE44784.1 23S rRNA pseudouridine1911/1915/1917 synthase [Desulfuromonas thiophila]